VLQPQLVPAPQPLGSNKGPSPRHLLSLQGLPKAPNPWAGILGRATVPRLSKPQICKNGARSMPRLSSTLLTESNAKVVVTSPTVKCTCCPCSSGMLSVFATYPFGPARNKLGQSERLCPNHCLHRNHHKNPPKCPFTDGGPGMRSPISVSCTLRQTPSGIEQDQFQQKLVWIVRWGRDKTNSRLRTRNVQFWSSHDAPPPSRPSACWN
jgi:hypothetical protein